MNDEEDLVEADCPSCGMTEHAILHEREDAIKLQCQECHRVQTLQRPKQKSHQVPLIVSHGDQSDKHLLEVVSGDEVEVGGEFDFMAHRMRVTAIETQDGGHPAKADAAHVKLLHAVVFDTVPLKIACNQGDITKSYRLDVEPEREVFIGEVFDIDGDVMAVKTLKSDQNRTLHRGFLLARNITRVFCDPAPGHKQGDRVQTRPRGLGKDLDHRGPKRPHSRR